MHPYCYCRFYCYRRNRHDDAPRRGFSCPSSSWGESPVVGFEGDLLPPAVVLILPPFQIQLSRLDDRIRRIPNGQSTRYIPRGIATTTVASSLLLLRCFWLVCVVLCWCEGVRNSPCARVKLSYLLVCIIGQKKQRKKDALS